LTGILIRYLHTINLLLTAAAEEYGTVWGGGSGASCEFSVMSGQARASVEAGPMSAAAKAEALAGLVAAARRGNRVAADRLVRDHDRWLRAVIYATTGRTELVDDVAQQVWAQVWQRLNTLDDPRRLRSWLYSIARNAAIDASTARGRQDGRTVALETLPAQKADQRTLTPAAALIGNETQRLLLQAVEALPALYREPFVLRHLENWSYAQIAEVLGVPVETVETRLVRARRLLREMLRDKVP
jgi:RNA polymerase sigma-70 factor (ECF subfamily)